MPLRILIFALISLILPNSFAYSATRSLTGAGATFPYPLYSKWFSEYAKLHPGIEINYQSIGSGGGVRQLLENTIDFGATDTPMKDNQLKNAKIPILHFPMILGAVCLAYHLDGITEPLKLTAEVVSDLFLGKIFYWNDVKIQTLNPGIKLPDLPVMIVHRSDGSGTTAVFTDYLSKVSPEWKAKVGSATSVKWPVGLGGKGNEGVTGFIKQSPGAIGYVELLYAEKNHLAVAHLQNAAGLFIKPESKSITASASNLLKEIPPDFRYSITQAPGKDSYPISAFTYLLVYQQMPKAKGETLVSFLDWALSDGQKLAESMFYAPLPKALSIKARAKIKEIKFKP